jgi:hypothetical protein
LIERRKATSIVPLFVTHHALSRAAQLFGLRTQQHMVVLTQMIFHAMVKECDTSFDTPPQGRRLSL